MSLTKYIKPTVTSLAVAASLNAGSVLAQDGRLEEIVVTAQHRAQSIQDVPITVTAISAAELEAGQIFDIGSIANNVPGMTLGEFSPGQPLISLRGVGSADDGAGLDNSVALFFDGIYIGRFAGINFDMFDLERIEVLKGPQGTLFGRNAIGGAINVITSDNLRGKIVVNHREHDGFVRNTLLNKDVQDEDYTSFRGQLLWVGENSEWLLGADYMEDDRGDIGRAPIFNGNFDYTGTAESLGAGRFGTTASPTDGFT